MKKDIVDVLLPEVSDEGSEEGSEESSEEEYNEITQEEMVKTILEYIAEDNRIKSELSDFTSEGIKIFVTDYVKNIYDRWEKQGSQKDYTYFPDKEDYILEDLEIDVENIIYLMKQKQKEVAIMLTLRETIPFNILELINEETKKKMGGGYENDDKINKEFMIETILNKINEEGIDMSVFNKEDIDKFLDEYVENYIKQIEENINNAKKRYEILDYPTQWEWEYEYLAKDWGEIIIKIEKEKKRIMATQITLSKTTELTVPNLIMELLSEVLKEEHNL